MSQLTVTDTPVQIQSHGSGTLVVQNLDATHPVYLDYTAEVTAGGPHGGIRLGPGLSTEWKTVTYATRDGAGPWAVCGSGQTAVIAYIVFLD